MARLRHFGRYECGNNRLRFSSYANQCIDDLLINSNIFTAIPLRLQGPQSSNGTGRVEIFYHGEWGTICDDYWSIVDANIACRQLGYQYAVKALPGYVLGNQGPGKIWLDNVQCTGGEKNLSSCSHRGWGIHDCTHRDDAGVECSSTGIVTNTVVIVISLWLSPFSIYQTVVTLITSYRPFTF